MTAASRCSPAPPWAFRLLALAAALVAVLVATARPASARPASAHPALVSSSPGPGYALTSAPAELVLNFNEPVSLPDRPLTVQGPQGPQGDPVDLAEVALDPGGTTLRGTPAAPLPEGAYALTYRVIGRDGDLVAEAFPFGVATAVGSAGGQVLVNGVAEQVQPLTTALRALLFLGLSLGLGGAYLAWRVPTATGGRSASTRSASRSWRPKGAWRSAPTPVTTASRWASSSRAPSEQPGAPPGRWR